MRKLLQAIVIVTSMASIGPAFADSHQGGYLGLNPGANAIASSAGPQAGSLQGGYLGKSAGAELQPLVHAGLVDAHSAPGAWCDDAIDRSRCLRRADLDHQYCMGHDADHYARCRRLMDAIGWSK